MTPLKVVSGEGDQLLLPFGTSPLSPWQLMVTPQGSGGRGSDRQEQMKSDRSKILLQVPLGSQQCKAGSAGGPLTPAGGSDAGSHNIVLWKLAFPRLEENILLKQRGA